MTYKTIVADPPWQYESKAGWNMNHGSSMKYNTMPTKEICEMDIVECFDKDSVLFLWATIPMLPDGMRVLEAWGYKYKTSIIWRKIMSLGMGWWFRGQCELCLVGVRGNVRAFRSQSPNFIQSRARKHSQKPEEFWGMILPVAPRPIIELFARQRREGVTGYGDQLEESMQRTIDGNQYKE